jgi:hypothetical protein
MSWTNRSAALGLDSWETHQLGANDNITNIKVVVLIASNFEFRPVPLFPQSINAEPSCCSKLSANATSAAPSSALSLKSFHEASSELECLYRSFTPPFTIS